MAMSRQETGSPALSYRQVLRTAALEAASRILQGQTSDSSRVIQMSEEFFQWIGWGSEEPEDERADKGY